MSETNEEHREIEGTLKRVRLCEPSAALKGKVLGAAREAWRQESAGVPWQIPFRRLVVSAAAAVLIAALANLYGACASIHHPAGIPMVRYAEPCDLEALIDVPAPLIRYTATAGGPMQPGARALLGHLEMVREALRETERGRTSEEPAPVERRSRLPEPPLSLNS